MSYEFQHISDTPFPHFENVDVYKYTNDFDYSRYTPDVDVDLLRVPWSNSYENVVDFGSATARDEWFAEQVVNKLELDDCMCKVPTTELKVPLPYNEVMRYNYVHVSRETLTSESDPVAYETPDAIHEWFYFLIEAEPLATNTTRLVLAIDWFTTFWYSTAHPYCMLERGHYPMMQTTPQAFLADPIQNNQWLLAPDVNFSNPQLVASYSDYVLNSTNSIAVIATSCQPNGSWSNNGGEQTTPSSVYYSQNGVPAYNAFAVEASDLGALMNYLAANRPQMMQTIQGIYFLNRLLLNLGASFSIGTHTCYQITPKPTNINLLDLNIGHFALPNRYKNITKLYTYPYSVIEVTDSKGTVTQIRVEDTTGKITCQAVLSIVMPYLGVDIAITSSGALAGREVIFKNLTQSSRMLFGDWYKNLMHFDIPVYGIFENAYDYDTFSNQWQRDASTYSANQAYASAVESANTSVTNTANSGAAQTNNTALSVAVAAGNVARNNSASTEITAIGNSTSQAAQAYDSGLQRGVQEADAKTVAATTLTNAIGGVASALSSGNPAGAIGSVISGVTSGVNAAVMLNAESTKVELSISNSQSKVTSQNNSNTSINSYSCDAQSSNVAAGNQASVSQTANSVSAANTNATNSANTSKNNALRSQQSSLRSIEDGRKANYVKPPLSFGERSGSSLDVDSPQLMSACVVTQLEGTLALAGDAMLRYGYMYNGQVPATNLNVCSKFSYWQGDMTIIPTVAGVTAGAQNALQEIFKAGVTVYKQPDYLGASIYDNDL